MLINDIKKRLVEIETINNLSREENQHLRGEYSQDKNNLKVEKTNNGNNAKELVKKSKRCKQNYPKQTDSRKC